MTKFNIIHVYPKGNSGPTSYNEVIITIIWGMRELGHSVSYKQYTHSANISDLPSFVSCIDYSAINIILGAQILHMPFLQKLPKNTVIYNLEQRLHLIQEKNPPEEYLYQAENFIIWDYSDANILAWRHLSRNVNACHVKIGYAPPLVTIKNDTNQDIDILIYGAPSPNRCKVFSDAAHLGLKTVFVCGFFGAERDDLIARSKVILNIHLEEYCKIFEIVRVSYLLANSKAVICELDVNTSVEQDFRESLVFLPLDQMASYSRQVVEDINLRRMLEQRGKNVIEARDIRVILSQAMVIV